MNVCRNSIVRGCGKGWGGEDSKYIEKEGLKSGDFKL